MRIAKFVTLDDPWPWRRQTPRGDGVFGDTRFVFDRDCKSYDYLVVFNQLPPELAERPEPQRAIFVAPEPAIIKRYDPAFLRQFGTVIAGNPDTVHPGCILSQVGSPWHVGVPTDQIARYGESLSFEQLAQPVAAKPKLMSVICSDKAFTPAHRRRLELVKALQDHFGNRLDFFGRGIRDLEDKAEALLPYRYHVTLENTDACDGWTEKLADAFLAETFPIYWGCRNAEDYFPPDSFARIPMDDHAAAIGIIEKIIAGGVADAARPAVQEAKRRVLYEHNIFALLDRTLAALSARTGVSAGAPVRLLPETAFAPAPALSWLARIKALIARVLRRHPVALDLLRRCYRSLVAMSGMRRRIQP
jgi:hypothetical protein